MSYSVILSGVFLFILSVCLHVIVWRFKNPKNHLLALSLIFFALPAALLIGASYCKTAACAFPVYDRLLIWLLDFSLSAAYVMTYPAVQATSPTLLILLIVGASMPEGASYDEIRAYFSEEEAVGARLRDLLDARFIRASDKGYSVTPAGSFLLTPFIVLRRLLGLPVGKG